MAFIIHYNFQISFVTVEVFVNCKNQLGHGIHVTANYKKLSFALYYQEAVAHLDLCHNSTALLDSILKTMVLMVTF